MALTEKQEWKVEVLPSYSILQIRRADIILKDGEEVARSYHRHVVSPGDDCSGECDCVKKVAAALHDEACCAAYQASLPAPEPETGTMPAPEPEATTMPAPERQAKVATKKK